MVKIMANIRKGLLILSLVMVLTLTVLPFDLAAAQDETLFSVTIIAPGNANMLRRQWGQIVANSLIQLGIDARVVYLGWASVYDRVFTPPEENVGKTYAEGGFDIQLVGWTPGLIPEPSQLYYGSEAAFAPTGSNYYLFNNTEANDLMDIFLTTSNTTERDEVSKTLQTIFYNELPASQIMYQSTPTAVTPELGGPALGASPGGEGWLYFNAQPNPEMLTGKTQVVYASTGEIESLIPPLSNSWYDTIITANVFGGLVMVNPDLSDLAMPNLLTSWVPSNDGFKWTWTCRSGVFWHDGAAFSADDVVFSLWANLNSTTGTQQQGVYSTAFGDNVKFTYADSSSATAGNGTRVGNVKALDATTVEIWLPELLPGKPYGYFDPYLLGFANNIIPKHIFENIDPADWTDSPFNTGDGTIVIPGTPGTVAPETYNGPVGTGPYRWVDFDAVGQVVHLEKNTGYWNRSALEGDGLFGVEDYYIRFIADKTPALAALKNNEVDILDPQYQIQVDVPTIDPAWATVLLNEGTGRQEVGYNNNHPVFGSGVDTPLGVSDPSRAAEAAKYVRMAFDHAIPRQLIIDNLLAGYGQPAATLWLPTHPFYDASITARSYNLTKAMEYLAMAGYGAPLPPPRPTVPSFIQGMSYPISGIYTDSDGNPLADRELELREVIDNTTYEVFSTVDRTTTDLSGWYGFSVTPPDTGVFYYYLFDRLATIGTEWTYVAMLNVSSVEDLLSPTYDLITEQSNSLETMSSQIDALQGSVNTLMYVAAAALIVAVVLAIAIFVLGRRL